MNDTSTGVSTMRSRGIIVAILLFGCLPAARPAPASAQSKPDEREAYRVVNGWPLLPEGRVLGQVAGVGVDSRGDVLVFHRASRVWTEPLPEDPILEPTVAAFDGETGRLVKEWGSGVFVMPHGLTVDHEDNVWVTDVALHQVMKFSHDGELLLAVGEAGVPGADADHFDMPSDVAVLPDGSFYVTDGYRNTRVVKFSPDGEYLFEWGTPGSGPGELELPHGITIDGDGTIYVADRSNARIQLFDPRGGYLAEWKGPDIGRPYGLDVASDGAILSVDGGDQPEAPPDRSRAMRLDPTGRVAATFGRFGNQDGQFMMGHDIAAGPDGAVYVGDIVGRRVQKFIPAENP